MSAEPVKKNRGFWNSFFKQQPDTSVLTAQRQAIQKALLAKTQAVPTPKKDSKTMFESYYNEEKKFELLGRVITSLAAAGQPLDLKIMPVQVDSIIKIGFEAGVKFGRANPIHTLPVQPTPPAPLPHN